MENRKKVMINMVCLLIITSLFTSFIPTNVLHAATTTYKYYDYSTKKTKSYNDSALTYICNGASVDLSKTPAMLSSNGVALCSVTALFSKTLGLTCIYDSNAATVTISDASTTIIVKIGSKTAIVNGESVSINAAPVKVKYADSKLTRVLVPTRFICETLGYEYDWNSANATITIGSSMDLSINNIGFTYKGDTTSISINNKLLSFGSLPVITMDKVLFGPAKKIFTKSAFGVDYSYDSTTNTLKLVRDESTVIFTLGSKSAYVNGVAFQLPIAPNIVTNNVSGSYAIYVPLEFTATALGLDLNNNSIQCNCTITTADSLSLEASMNELIDCSTALDESVSYFEWLTTDSFANQLSYFDSMETNYLSAFTAGCDNYGEYIILKTKYEATPTIAEDDYSIHLVFDNVINTVGDHQYSTKSYAIDYCMVESPTDNSTCVIIKKPSYYSGYVVSTLEDGSYCLRMNNSYSYEAPVKSEEDDVITLSDQQIYIPLPDSISYEKVTFKDYYWNNQIIIVLDNDYTEFYKENPISYQHPAISGITTQLNSSKKTEIVIKTTKIQGFKSLNSSGGFVMTIDNPGNIYKAVVVLDPGHGGKDPGASYKSSNGTLWNEKDINLSVLTLAASIFNNTDIKAYMTRINDTYIELADRAAYPDLTDADLFISFHCNVLVNASKQPVTSAVGTGTYYSTLNKNTSTGGITSRMLASKLVSSVSSALSTTNRGITTADYVVVRDTKVPAVLIEAGFMTNSTELDKLTSSTYQSKIAQNIYDTVAALFETYPEK